MIPGQCSPKFLRKSIKKKRKKIHFFKELTSFFLCLCLIDVYLCSRIWLPITKNVKQSNVVWEHDSGEKLYNNFRVSSHVSSNTKKGPWGAELEKIGVSAGNALMIWVHFFSDQSLPWWCCQYKWSESTTISPMRAAELTSSTSDPKWSVNSPDLKSIVHGLENKAGNWIN